MSRKTGSAYTQPTRLTPCCELLCRHGAFYLKELQMPAEAEPDGHGELAEHTCVGCVPVLAGVSCVGGLCCKAVHRMDSWWSTDEVWLVYAASAGPTWVGALR